jgi:hypothetical protein
MRTLVIGDIHGGLRALHQIIERAHVTPQDTLIFFRETMLMAEPITTSHRLFNSVKLNK